MMLVNKSFFLNRSRVSNAARGASMLEVLISIVVLSIGALGVAGMQVAALKDSGSAGSRHRAASLATAMVNTLRADRTQAVTGAAPFVSSLSAGSCTGTDTDPVKVWQNQVACALPDGRGGVAIDTYTKRAIVTVQWDDSRGKSGSTTQSFLLETRL